MGAIEVDNGYIKNIYFEDSDLPSEIETIDVEGKYIIPGLIDMHCHITGRLCAAVCCFGSDNRSVIRRVMYFN